MGEGIIEKIFSGSSKSKEQPPDKDKKAAPPPPPPPEKNVITNIKDKKKALKEILDN